MYDKQRRRPPDHDKFSSPDFERQQRQRTGHPADNLPARLRDRIKWDVDDDAQQQEEEQRPAAGDDNPRQQPDRRQPQQRDEQQGGSGGGGSGSGGRARIEFSLDKLQSPAGEAETKPRLSSKYSKDLGTVDPPILRRLSATLSDKQAGDAAAAADADAADGGDRGARERQQPPREQQQRQQRRSETGGGGGGGGGRVLSPDRGPPGRDRLQERERERDRDRSTRERDRSTREREGDRQRDRDRDREPDLSRRRAAAAERTREASRDRPRPRSSSDGGPERSRDTSRDHSRPRSRERSRERAVQASRERSSRDYDARDAAAAAAAARDKSSRGAPSRGGEVPGRDSSRSRGAGFEGERDSRQTAARDNTDDGFARPQPRLPPPPPPSQPRVQPLPSRPRLALQDVSWADAQQAEALLGRVRARHAGLVEQQLSHLILTQALTKQDVWAAACKAANIAPELLDGPLVTMARRSDCDHALMSRASAHIMPPLDPGVPSALEAAGEDVYIQQLQAVINRYEQQSAAPYCAEVWSLKSAAEVARRGAGGGQQQQQTDEEGVSYPLLLPAELRGLLWDA